jgi:hypothetical protein
LACTSNELRAELDKEVSRKTWTLALTAHPHRKRNSVTQVCVVELALPRLLCFLTRTKMRAAIAAAISPITAMRTGRPSCDMTVSTCRP